MLHITNRPHYLVEQSDVVVVGAAPIPAAGAVLFTLVSIMGMWLVPAAIVAVLVSVGLTGIMETGVMRPMAGWRRVSGRGGATESAIRARGVGATRD